MEVKHKGELMGLLSYLILPSFRESPFAEFQHCQGSVLRKHGFPSAKGKDQMCPIRPGSASVLPPQTLCRRHSACETGKAACPKPDPLLPRGSNSGHGQSK